MGSIAEHGPELWDEMRRVNLLTTINMVRAVWPGMQAAGRGSLVAIGATPSLHSGAGMAAYAGAKAAVNRDGDWVEAYAARVPEIRPVEGLIDSPGGSQVAVQVRVCPLAGSRA